MIAERVRGITPFLAMEVLERAQKLEREGASIIHLELGEPDFDTPECIRQAAFKALDEGQTHYTHSLVGMQADTIAPFVIGAPIPWAMWSCANICAPITNGAMVSACIPTRC